MELQYPDSYPPSADLVQIPVSLHENQAYFSSSSYPRLKRIFRGHIVLVFTQ